MNYIVYLSSLLICGYCIEQAIRMTLHTNVLVVLSHVVFFSTVVGVTLWVYYCGTNTVLSLLMASTTMIIYCNKRQTT